MSGSYPVPKELAMALIDVKASAETLVDIIEAGVEPAAYTLALKEKLEECDKQWGKIK